MSSFFAVAGGRYFAGVAGDCDFLCKMWLAKNLHIALHIQKASTLLLGVLAVIVSIIY